MKTVTLYTKPGCHLCAAVEQVLHAVCLLYTPFHVETRNIQTDPELFERFKHDVPVVEVDGVEIARHRLDPVVLLRAVIPTAADLAVVVMAKYPAPGRVKTRLQPALKPEQAADVQRVFLSHTIQKLREAILCQIIVCCDPPEMLSQMQGLFNPQVREEMIWLPQATGDLGARIASAAAEAFERFERLLFVGVDAPDLPPSLLIEAVCATETSDVVLGPTPDGGYWCLGMRQSVDPGSLLRNIEWSSGQERSQTIARAEEMGYDVAMLSEWFDVDRPEDLKALVQRVRTAQVSALGGLYPLLRKVLPRRFFV